MLKNRLLVCILIAVILIAALVNSVLADSNEETYSKGLPNGYYWDQLDQTTKADMVFALLMGYEWGYADGVVLASKKNGGSDVPTLPMMFVKPAYYANEIDSFYESYPACKKLDMLNIFGNLLSLWHRETDNLEGNGNITDVSYSQIGDMCLKASGR